MLHRNTIIAVAALSLVLVACTRQDSTPPTQPSKKTEDQAKTPEVAEADPDEPVWQGQKLSVWIEGLGDYHEPTRKASFEAVVGVGEDAVPYLEKALENPSMRVRDGARKALERIEDGPPRTARKKTQPVVKTAEAPPPKPAQHDPQKFQKHYVTLARRQGLDLVEHSVESVLESPERVELTFKLRFEDCKLESLVRFLHQAHRGALRVRWVQANLDERAWDAVVELAGYPVGTPNLKGSPLAVLHRFALGIKLLEKHWILVRELSATHDGKGVFVCRIVDLAAAGDLIQRLPMVHLKGKTRDSRKDGRRRGYQISVSVQLSGAVEAPKDLRDLAMIWQHLVLTTPPPPPKPPTRPAVRPRPPEDPTRRFSIVMINYNQDRPQTSSVILKDNYTRRHTTLRLNDRFQGFRLIDILLQGTGDARQGRVTLESNGKRYLLHLKKRTQRNLVQPGPPKPGAKYWAGGQNLPEGEAVPGIPWLRRVPGVRYKPCRRMSRLLYRKLQSFPDAWKEAENWGGEYVETSSGTAYQVNWLNERSRLATLAGIRPGDRILSVNGVSLGKSVVATREVYERIKGQRRFAILVLRQGKPVVLSFEVNR